MTRFPLHKYCLAASIFLVSLAHAAPTTTTFFLAQNIPGDARPSDPVQLVDSERCHYLGKLVRNTDDRRDRTALFGFLPKGLDNGIWHMSVERKRCTDVVEVVNVRIPIWPPSFAGGAGFPPEPTGYKAGTKFVVTN